MNYQILVNKDNPLTKSFLNNIKLVETKDIDGKTVLVEKKALKEYLKLKEFLSTKDINIEISSAYRSITEQEETYNEFREKYGEEKAKQIVAPLFCSEHHTGLAIDISFITDEIEEELYQKVHPFLKDFGFILRYPKDKEEITKYSYEPWHIRYVGETPAEIIANNNLTLEEYDKLYNQDFVLVIDKPKDITSRDVVNKVCSVFNTKKVGHNGTLDPLATGVLVVTVNKATKLNEFLTSSDKEYIATVKMGLLTDTGDITGEVLKTSDKLFTKEEIEEMFNSFEKEYLQEVPIYSAVKINGKKLYQYARNKEEVELPKRKVLIKSLELLDLSKDTFTFKTTVSKGCYIRSLINDMAKKKDTCFTMEKLRRTRQGSFKIDDALKLDEVNISCNKIKIIDALELDKINLTEEEYNKIKNGVSINNKNNVKDKVFLCYNNKPVAIYINDNEKLKCLKML